MVLSAVRAYPADDPLTRANHSGAVASVRNRCAPQSTALAAARALAASHDFAPRANRSARSAQSDPDHNAGSNAERAAQRPSTS
jgi:hypothetical protein